jgi:hypothetical protein
MTAKLKFITVGGIKKILFNAGKWVFNLGCCCGPTVCLPCLGDQLPITVAGTARGYEAYESSCLAVNGSHTIPLATSGCVKSGSVSAGPCSGSIGASITTTVANGKYVYDIHIEARMCLPGGSCGAINPTIKEFRLIVESATPLNCNSFGNIPACTSGGCVGPYSTCCNVDDMTVSVP